MGTFSFSSFILSVLWTAGFSQSQELQERDALCNEDGCYAVYFQRKTFLDAWRSCKDRGGNLATVKRQEEAELIEELFYNVELRTRQVRVRVWIGLQRQPRQCSAVRPLRGYTWITGDQDTQYTNWQRDDAPSTCAAPRCVVMTYSRDPEDQLLNFKWLDGSCTLPVDGYLCRYTYKGMCPGVASEGGGPAVYDIPFKLRSTILTHVPFGSVVNVPCPEGTQGDQSALCMMRDGGHVGWSKEAPFCSVATKSWCQVNNGGCEHYCQEDGPHYYCQCLDGYELDEDGQSCRPDDFCQGNPCEFQCHSMEDDFMCSCPDGYLLKPNGQDCLDVDECLQSPCEQQCVNAPGTFECRCFEGYQLEEGGLCMDVDECLQSPCEQLCVNMPGTFECRCFEGYQLEEGGLCRDMEGDVDKDVDECLQSPCEQLCVNVPGTFECRCFEGYQLEEGGLCMDVDECLEDPCDHACENTPGSYTCHCHLGFFPPPEAPASCLDVDECQIPDTCQQMCVNEVGGFQCHCEEQYELQADGFSCLPLKFGDPGQQQPPPPSSTFSFPWVTDFPDLGLVPDFRLTEAPPLEWLTVLPSLDWLRPDWFKHPPPSPTPPVTTPTPPNWTETPGWPSKTSSTAMPTTPTPDWSEEEEDTVWPSPTHPSTAWLDQDTPTAKAVAAETTTQKAVQRGSVYKGTRGGAREWQPTTEPMPHEGGALPENQREVLAYEEEGITVADIQTTLPEHAVPSSPPPVPTGSQGPPPTHPDTQSPPPAPLGTEGPPLNSPASGGPQTTLPGSEWIVTAPLGTEGPPRSGSRQRHDNNWLLVALLVPLSIFVVVMLALGIVYCTRCAVRPRSKSVADCYRWVTNSGDKAGAEKTGSSRV
ncbi:endosialin [Amia ocellicauda]|uniref:endosialin n=1 Tax=Amia ocellicauda TaxID=2972642 RepID=UPI0034648B92